MPHTGYRGRFAPSPTGPLHFGSLVAALASFLDARAHNGKWLVRIEDIDPPREQAGADREILGSLETLGLTWDETVLYQSTRSAAYREALDELMQLNLLYACACSRREVAGRPYPGTCREGIRPGRRARSLRVRLTHSEILFDDAIRGRRRIELAGQSGDFIVRRGDGLTAYHLALTIDDAWQGITHVVRGGDLLEATAPQVYLQATLGLPTPRYAHLPTAVGSTGLKLSKQNRSPGILRNAADVALLDALHFLGQAPPKELQGATPQDIIAWAVANWDLGKIPSVETIATPRYAGERATIQ